MTFSIVAWDEITASAGVAVATKFLAVGAICPLARAGVGALASQAYIHPAYGPRALELMALDVHPAEVLRLILENDENREQRQLHIVDRHGNTAAYTGDMNDGWAGHKTFPGFSVAGTMLTGSETLEAMVAVFAADPIDHARNHAPDTNPDANNVPFPERLLSALEAGQAAGGDKRGGQSAALYITPGHIGLPIDLRVDDHPHPVAELRRIYEKAVEEYLPLRQFLDHAQS